MMITIEAAQKLTGISEKALRFMAYIGLLRKEQRNGKLVIELDDLISLEPIVIELAEEVATSWANYKFEIAARLFIHALTLRRGLIPIDDLAGFLGICKVATIATCKRWCTMKKILDKWYVVPDKKFLDFILHRIELYRKRQESKSR